MRKICAELFLVALMVSVSFLGYAESFDYAEYCPLAVNNYWNYGMSYSLQVMNTVDVNGVTTFRIRELIGTSDWYDTFYIIDEKGNRTFGGGDQVFGNFFFDQPWVMTPKIISSGAKYYGYATFKVAGIAFTVTSETTIIGAEDVTVNGFLFRNALKMTEKVTTSYLGQEDIVTSTSWDYKGFGCVKETYSNYDNKIESGKVLYGSGNIKYQLNKDADPDGYRFYEYIDENYNGRGYGRASMKQKANGDYIKITSYWGDTEYLLTAEYYDVKDRLVMERFDTGEFMVRQYFGDTNTRQYEHYYGDGWVWKKAIEYYTNGTVMKYQWVADVNPGQAGDDVLYYYDTQGRMTQKVMDDGGFVMTQYWGSTTNKHYDSFFGAGWVWQKAIEYYDDGTTMCRQWVADPVPGQAGDTVRYDYDQKGRMVQKVLDNGDFVMIEYWGDTANKKYDSFYVAGWVWQKAIEYYEGSGLMCRQWVKDLNPGTSGDEVMYDYDTLGRMVNKLYDNGDFVTTEYRGTTGNRLYECYYGAGWTWKKSIEFYEDGEHVNKQWFADQDPSNAGDPVYEEYDMAGTCVLRMYDDGSVWTPEMAGTASAEFESFVGSKLSAGMSASGGIILVPEMDTKEPVAGAAPSIL